MTSRGLIPWRLGASRGLTPSRTPPSGINAETFWRSGCCARHWGLTPWRGQGHGGIYRSLTVAARWRGTVVPVRSVLPQGVRPRWIVQVWVPPRESDTGIRVRACCKGSAPRQALAFPIFSGLTPSRTPPSGINAETFWRSGCCARHWGLTPWRGQGHGGIYRSLTVAARWRGTVVPVRSVLPQGVRPRWIVQVWVPPRESDTGIRVRACCKGSDPRQALAFPIFRGLTPSRTPPSGINAETFWRSGCCARHRGLTPRADSPPCNGPKNGSTLAMSGASGNV